MAYEILHSKEKDDYIQRLTTRHEDDDVRPIPARMFQEEMQWSSAHRPKEKQERPKMFHDTTFDYILKGFKSREDFRQRFKERQILDGIPEDQSPRRSREISLLEYKRSTEDVHKSQNILKNKIVNVLGDNTTRRSRLESSRDLSRRMDLPLRHFFPLRRDEQMTFPRKRPEVYIDGKRIRDIPKAKETPANKIFDILGDIPSKSKPRQDRSRVKKTQDSIQKIEDVFGEAPGKSTSEFDRDRLSGEEKHKILRFHSLRGEEIEKYKRGEQRIKSYPEDSNQRTMDVLHLEASLGLTRIENRNKQQDEAESVGLERRKRKENHEDSTMSSENYRVQIATFKRSTFQRYSHYRTILKNLASGLKKKYNVEESRLLPKESDENPRLAFAVGKKQGFDRVAINDDPIESVHCTLEQAVLKVDCLVVSLDRETKEDEKEKQFQQIRKTIDTLRDKRDGFLTVIFIASGPPKIVSGNVNLEEICFAEVNDDRKQIKALIVSSLERRLLLTLEKFKVGSVEGITEEDKRQLEMEINVHSSSLRKYSVLFKEKENNLNQEVPRCFPTALEKFLTKHRMGIYKYGVFFQEIIVYIDKTYEEIDRMRSDLRELEQNSELQHIKKIVVIPTVKVDPEPLRFCSKALYGKPDANTSLGTLGGLAVTIDSKSQEEAKVGVSCYHVTNCAEAEDWFIRSKDGKLEKLGNVRERSDCWITDESDEIYCDLSLIEIDKSFLRMIRKEELLYLSLSGERHKMVEMLGVENPFELQDSERHVYRLTQDNQTQFVEGFILGYLWRPSEQIPNKNLRSLIIAKSSSQSLLDDIKRSFAKKGDSGSLVFSSGFDEEGDEILYVRAMVTHGFVDDEDPNGKQDTFPTPEYDGPSKSQSPVTNEYKDQFQVSEHGAYTSWSQSRFTFQIAKDKGMDYRLYTYCMEMDKANEILKRVTNKYLVFDMNKFEK